MEAAEGERGAMGSPRRESWALPPRSTDYGQMAVLYVDSAESEKASPTVIGHSGSDGTFAWAWPKEDLMVLYFTQSRGGISGTLSAAGSAFAAQNAS